MRLQLLRLLATHWKTGRLMPNISTSRCFRSGIIHDAVVDNKRGGIFGLGINSPTDFRSLTRHVQEKGSALLAEALSDRRRKRKLVAVLDELSDTICQAADMAECIRMVHPDQSYAEEAEQCVSRLGQLVESLNSNGELYSALCHSYESNDADSSCAESMDYVDRRVIEMLMEDMQLSGVHLPNAQRNQFIDLNTRIFETGSEFVKLAQELKILQNRKNLSTSESVRRQKENLQSLLILRHRLAQLTGYQSYAERALKSSFLETPTKVNDFLFHLVNGLKLKKSTAGKSGDQRQLEKDGVSITLHQLINEKINPVAEKLVGLWFERQTPGENEIWHPSVTKLVAYDQNSNPVGVVYCDWYDRERKCGDAHFTVRCGREIRDDGNTGYQSPIVVLSFRLLSTVPGSNKPDYWTTPFILNGSNAETIFHEFGHALHTLVGRTRYQHVSGTRCSTDLAEVPSTFLEHYILDEKAARSLWASAFDTHRLRTREDGIMEALSQSVVSLTDLRLHSTDPERLSLDDICASVGSDLGLPGMTEQRLLVFEHLVPYGAKYHSYVVAKALAALLWKRSESNNTLYKRFLSYGGEKYPHELLQLTLDHVPTSRELAESIADDIACTVQESSR